jgi:hypothetical protein
MGQELGIDVRILSTPASTIMLNAMEQFVIAYLVLFGTELFAVNFLIAELFNA